MTRRTGRLLRATCVALVVGSTAVACADSEPAIPDIGRADLETAADHDFHIPAGTGDRLDAGERLELIPAELEVHVGEVIRIVNDDDRGHVIGAFFVGAGETLSQRFASPGELAGECSVHPSGSFKLTVLE